jgi:hypothetical protein
MAGTAQRSFIVIVDDFNGRPTSHWRGVDYYTIATGAIGIDSLRALGYLILKTGLFTLVNDGSQIEAVSEHRPMLAIDHLVGSAIDQRVSIELQHRIRCCRCFKAGKVRMSRLALTVVPTVTYPPLERGVSWLRFWASGYGGTSWLKTGAVGSCDQKMMSTSANASVTTSDTHGWARRIWKMRIVNLSGEQLAIASHLSLRAYTAAIHALSVQCSIERTIVTCGNVWRGASAGGRCLRSSAMRLRERRAT